MGRTFLDDHVAVFRCCGSAPRAATHSTLRFTSFLPASRRLGSQKWLLRPGHLSHVFRRRHNQSFDHGTTHALTDAKTVPSRHSLHLTKKRTYIAWISVTKYLNRTMRDIEYGELCLQTAFGAALGGAREAPYSNGEDSSMKQAGWQIVKISDSVSGPVPNR